MNSEEENCSKYCHFQRSLKSQLTLLGVCCTASIICGMSAGHTSVLLPELQSNHSSIPTDKDMGAWIASVHSIMMPIGCFIGGILADCFGRRSALMLSSGMFVVGWLLICGAWNHGMIILGRVIDGASKGMLGTTFEIMMDEFSDRSKRGSLLATIGAMFGFGNALIYGLGTIFDWRLTAGISAILPLITLVIFYLLPESAIWLVRKNRLREAKDSLNWSYGPGHEMQALTEFEDMVQRCQVQKRTWNNETSTRSLRNICKYWKIFITPHVLKPFLICIVFSWSQVFIGAHLFIAYAVDLVSGTLRNNETNIEAHIISIATALARTIVLVSCAVTLYWVGRRSHALGFGLLTSASALIIGVISYTQKFGYSSLSHDAEKWTIILLIALYITGSSCGFLLLPYIMTGEMLPNKVRGTLSGVVFGSCDLISAYVMITYPKLFSALGPHGLFLVFGSVAAAICVFLYAFLPETQGKTLYEIEDYFKQKNVMWLNRMKNNYRKPEIINVS